ncbi:MAG TPA: L-threonylcarbamoyladenylate synthase [Dehalococcoidales bacterium]|nr:MAG: threonylcarbamoyl-AMP synthase [Chloroflexi bacterium RBG_16_60_22]HJX12524.1 L-threonylcarbamoyladenylate synthase [Dehalococcoidales bacterium]
MKTRIEKVDAANPDTGLLWRAARLILRGGVVVCPTDTGYAFAANALDTRAIARVFHLKGRSFSNPIHVAVSSIDTAERYAHVDEAARYLAGHYLPGALTLVLPKKEVVPSLLVAGLDTVGIRIPDNPVILKLADMVDRPLTTTSANISGKPTPYTAEEVLEQLGENVKDVAMVLDQGPLQGRELSTIVDLTVSPPQLIRQGRVSWLELREVLKRFQNPEE